jgi:hypothetical protein
MNENRIFNPDHSFKKVITQILQIKMSDVLSGANSPGKTTVESESDLERRRATYPSPYNQTIPIDKK